MAIRLIKQRGGGLLAVGTKYQVKIPANYVKYRRGMSQIFGSSDGKKAGTFTDKDLFLLSGKFSDCYKCHKHEIVQYNVRTFSESAAIDRVCLNCGADNGDVAD